LGEDDLLSATVPIVRDSIVYDTITWMSSACDLIVCDIYSCTMKDRQHDHPTSLPLDLEIFLCFAIYSAGHAFNRVYKPLLEKLRLTYPQYIAMVLLWERDGQTVGELGQKLLLESNTLTPLLKRLETLGNVKRQRDPVDERQVRVHLTDAGRKLRQRASHIPRCILNATGLNIRQAKQLLEQIGALQRALASYSASIAD
jgi:MarR family transcriptional regulator, organic hydroperoxide resistance regulator